MGIDIVFYDASITGKKEGQGANGYYDSDTDTIYLDLQNAKDDAKTIAFTLSHELVHFIKKWSPDKYNEFAEFLIEQYLEHGISSASLLREKMTELDTDDVDYAFEEMICDACETMLLDSNATVKLMELRKNDLELFEKIKLHVLKILNAIREAYKSLGYQPSSYEAKALLSMKDSLEKFYSMFEEAAVDATKNYQSLGTEGYNESVAKESSENVKKQAKKTNRITLGMTDAERAAVLREETIDPKEIKVVKDDELDWEALEKNRKSAVEKPLIEKLRDLGYLRTYKTDNVNVEFEFTGGGLRKSLNAQVEHYGGSLADLTKVVMNMQVLLDNSVLLEIHKDKAKGTPKENTRLMQVYVLLSAYKENGFITPVQFEIKQFIDNQNRLYLAVALTKIEASVLDDTALLDKNEEERTRLIPASTYSIPQLIKEINPVDENFFKYIPDELLNEGQKKAKKVALEKEVKKYDRGITTPNAERNIKQQKKKTSDKDYLDTTENGDMESAQGMVDEAAKETDSEHIKKQAKKQPNNPYQGKSLYIDSDIYDYAFMTSLVPMKVETMPPLSDVKENGRISHEKVIKLGLENAKKVGNRVDTDQYAIKNAYTEREIILGKNGLKHSLYTSEIHRLRTNARLSAIGASIVQNAIPINGLKKENSQANGTYAMACLVNDGAGYVVAIVTVDEFASRVVGIDVVDLTHSINGRFTTKKEDSRSSTREKDSGENSLSNTTISKISIADFLEIVNSSHRSILSNDVLRHFNEERPSNGHYADRVLFQKKKASNREILASTLEGAIDSSTPEGEITLKKLKEYRDKIELIEKEEARLAEIKAEIKKISFTKGADRSRLKELNDEKIKTANRISIYDRQLLRLEAMKPITDLLTREKEKARKAAEKKGREAMARYRERANKTEMRHKIKDVVNELNKYLTKGTKEKHVPIELQKAVAEALDAVNMDMLG